MDFSHLSAAERQHLESVMEKKQMQESIKIYNNIVDRCFQDCIADFTSSALGAREESCVGKCVDKFLKQSERVSQRFAESQVALQQRQMLDASTAQ